MSYEAKRIAKYIGDPAAAAGLFGVLVVAGFRYLLGRAPFPAPAKCSCGAPRDPVTKLCLEGCDPHRKPHVRGQVLERKLRRRERQSSAPTLARAETSRGAARVSPTINTHPWAWGVRRRRTTP